MLCILIFPDLVKIPQWSIDLHVYIYIFTVSRFLRLLGYETYREHVRLWFCVRKRNPRTWWRVYVWNHHFLCPAGKWYKLLFFFFYQSFVVCLSLWHWGTKSFNLYDKITEGAKQVENEADTFFFSNLNTTPKTTIGGKASLQPKRTPVSNEEMEAILVRYLLLL